MTEAVKVAAWAVLGSAVFSLIFGAAVVIGAESAILVNVADNPMRWLTWPGVLGAIAGAAWAVIRLEEG